MKDEGYTWSDLAGELMARGINPEDISDVTPYLNEPTAERCADRITQELNNEAQS